MRIVYLGTSDFAAAVLRAARRQPAPPGARRHAARPPPRPRAAAPRRRRPPRPRAELGIDAAAQAETSTSDEALERIRAAGPELGVVCAFGQLIARAAALASCELLNVHPSLLPRWRGAAPIERAIMAGDARDRRLRSCGSPRASTPARSRSREAVRDRPDDDFGALSARLAELGGELLVEALDLPRRRAELEFDRAGRRARRPTRRRSAPASAASTRRARRSSSSARSARLDPAHRRLPRARRRRAARGATAPARRAPASWRPERSTPRAGAAARLRRRGAAARARAAGRRAADGRGGLPARPPACPSCA